MSNIVWPCGGHKYEDVGVVFGACHDIEVGKLRAALKELTNALVVLDESRGEPVWPGQREAVDELHRLIRLGLAETEKEKP